MTYNHADPTTWAAVPPCRLDRWVGACFDTLYAALTWMTRA